MENEDRNAVSLAEILILIVSDAVFFQQGTLCAKFVKHHQGSGTELISILKPPADRKLGGLRNIHMSLLII